MFKYVVCLLLISLLYSDENKSDSNEQFIFPLWREMSRLNKYPIESEDHRAYVDIHVNDLARDSYIKESDEFEVGSIIIKPLYPKADRENISKIMIMIKMESGYDTEHNNWWYGVYDESGRNAMNEGKINSCIVCHEVAEDTDYLFSESVMFKIKSQPILKNSNSIHKPHR